MSMDRIAVIASSFNRKAKTLAGLESLFRQKPIEELTVTVYLVDDGSTDGTADAVAERFPQVRLLHGNGSLWWAGAMRMGFAAAMAAGYDGYLWWNDDTALMDDALHRIVVCAREIERELGPAIVVGSVCDAQTGERSYGGIRKRASGLRLDFIPVEPDPVKALPCDTMNGNFTLVPDSIARKLRNLDAAFQHQIADVDYGLRATAAKLPVVVAPGFYGFCTDNPRSRTWRDDSISRAARWKQLMSPKGAPPREWLLYTSRHFGWRWPLYFVSPYLKVLLK